jgi:hypothetical protein
VTFLVLPDVECPRFVGVPNMHMCAVQNISVGSTFHSSCSFTFKLLWAKKQYKHHQMPSHNACGINNKLIDQWSIINLKTKSMVVEC